MATRSMMVVAAAMAATIGTGAVASGSVILFDSFDGRTNGSGSAPLASDWGMNDNALGGTIAQTYECSNPFNSTVARVQNGYGELGWAFAEIQHDFAGNLAGGGLRWEFKVNFPGSAGGHVSWWLGTATGDIVPGDISTPPDQIPLQKTETDVGLIMRANPGSTGWTVTNKGGNGNAGNGGSEISFPVTGLLNPRGQDNLVVLELFTSSAALNSPATLRLTLNSTVVDINGAAPGTDYAFTWDGQGEAYGGFGSNINAYYLVDDLVVSAIPEPSAIGAMATGLVLLKRRRKA